MSPYRKRILFYVLGSIFLGFLLLTALVYYYPNSVIDRKFSEEIQEYQYPVVDTAMKFVSFFGYMPYSMLSVGISALIFYIFKFKKEALFVLLTLVSGLISALMKIIVARPRPTESLVRIVEKAQSKSFPSGHVIHYVAFFGFLLLLMYHLKTIPKAVRIVVGFLCSLMILTVPLSRIYLGAHWFSDVLGGFFLGMICLLILSYLYLRKPI